jgi:hypothetical protein
MWSPPAGLQPPQEPPHARAGPHALLYAPYVPSLWEDFILRNRRILADQMEFLLAHVPRSSRLVL